jgi:CRP-like cAMP-binding protein
MRLFRDDLAELPLFSEASRSERAVIRQHLTPLIVSAGTTLIREGARGDEFMVLLEGNATVSQGGQTIATLERGDLVGEMALLEADGGRRRNATVTVSTDAVVFVGSRREFRQILQAAPSVARKVFATAAARNDARAAA